MSISKLQVCDYTLSCYHPLSESSILNLRLTRQDSPIWKLKNCFLSRGYNYDLLSNQQDCESSFDSLNSTLRLR